MKSVKSARDRFLTVAAYLIVILAIMSTTVMWNYLKGAFIPIGTYRYLLFGIGVFLALITNEYHFKDLSMIVFVYCRQKQGRLLLASYANIVLVVAAVSLYFFGSVLGLKIGAVNTVYYWANNPHFTTSYCYLYFHQPLQDQLYLGHHVIRNTGIFTEAPGYTFFS